MTATVFAKDLSLAEVHRMLGFERRYASGFEGLLELEPLTEAERQEVSQIREDFDQYLVEGQVLEGMVKILSLLPLLRLAGFYRHPLKLHLEERVSQIEVEDEEKVIKGRLDLLAVSQTVRTRDDSPFWVLLIEAKNSEIATSAGLAQLLVYAHEALQRQERVWGLVTNGLDYQFVRLVMEGQPRYELLPQLHFMDEQPGAEVVRVLKAIRMVMS